MTRRPLLTAARALAEAQLRGLDRLDVQILLSHVLGQSRGWLMAHDDHLLDPPQVEHLNELLGRRATGEPVAYLVGEKEFHGLTLRVSPAVLVPRPDTETLVDWALEVLDGDLRRLEHPAVIDLGTGSGAIALAIQHRHPASIVAATDQSAEALAVASDNARHLGLNVAFWSGNWWEAVSGRRFDLALSNPPYIAAADPHLPALRHEPLSALTPGGDGLDAVRRIVQGAPAHLAPGGWLLFEHGHDQADAVSALMGADFESVSTRQDLGGNPRCTGGRLR